MAQSALQARAAAAATVKESIRALDRYIKGENPSPRLLKNKLDKLTADREQLVARHYAYGDKSNKDYDSEEMLEWITPILDTVMDISDEAFLKLETFERETVLQQETLEQEAIANARTNELTLAEMQYKTNENALRERIDAMMEVVNDETKVTDDDANLIRTYLTQVEDFMSEQIKSWNMYKSLSPSADKLTEVFNEEEELKKHVSENCVLAAARAAKIKPESILLPRESIASSSSSASVVNETFTSGLKSEKIKNPTFNGDIRSFARFKANFKDIVVPNNPSEKAQTYILKEHCLQGDCKRLIANMTDLEAIWERLEARYGDEIEIVNSVISEIQDFQLNKSDQDRSLIKFVDKLERGVEDLSAIEARSHIANAYTVKLLESKLSREVRLRWFQHEDASRVSSVETPVKESSKISKSTATKSIDRRFELMLDFLKRERKQAERLLLLTNSKQPSKPKDSANDDKKKQFNGAVGGGASPTLKKQCLIHANGNHFTRKCKAFLSKTVDERGSIVKDADACKLCLSTSHVGQTCPFEATWNKCDVQNCNQPHSRLLHGCQIQGINCFVNELCNNNLSPNNTLLLIESVKSKHITKTIAFWDGGSTLTLVSKSYAKRNKLQGVPILYDLTTVGNKLTTYDTMLYEITLVSRKGEQHVIQAFEIENICGSLMPVNTKQFAKLFPSTKPSEIARPSGEIDILIGNDYAPIFPDKKYVRENLVLYESQFGTGKVLGGAHKSINESVISANVHRCAKARIQNVRVSQRFTKPSLDFMTTEAFGVEPPRICKECKGCKSCNYDVHQISRVDQEKIEIIRKHMNLDPVSHKWTVQYPCEVDPNKLVNNKEQAQVLAERTEKRLIKDNVIEVYNEQVNDMIKRGVLVEISKEEVNSYEGPVYYVSHHDVRKPHSSSTPLRIVINSSLRYQGLSPNDVWIKAPNQLNDMWGILIRFRDHKIALVGDIKKMYNTIHTTSTEKHMRRVLWRFGKQDEEFKTFGIDRVMFGDRPAAAITSIAIRETAEIYRGINEAAAQKIIDDTYVDDITTGADNEDDITVLRSNMKCILSKAGLEVHEFVRSGDNTKEALSVLGNGEVSRVLGTGWNPTTDLFSVTVKINISKKYRGARTEQDYKREDIPKLISVVLTRRILQGIVYSCFDVYGLVAPITIQMKIELRNLFSKDLNLTWDQPVPEEIKRIWIKILQRVKAVEDVKFKRCVKPDNPVFGKPDLIICNDGSQEAICATAHVRWELEDGTGKCSLYAAKTRVAPLRKESVPRLEMQSAVMGARLRRSITMNTTLDFNEIFHVLDSKCTLAILHKETMSLKEFMGNRASEIQKKTDIEEWVHTASKENIADLGTRKNATVADISEGSEWQDGKMWMRLPKKDWPVSKDFSGQDIPTEELVTKGVAAFASNNITSMYDIERFRGKSYTFLINVTARVLNIFRKRSLREVAATLTAKNVIDAEKFCLQVSMLLTKLDFAAGKFKSLRAQMDDEGVICVNSRANNAMQSHYGCDKFPILTYKDPLAYIWMQHVHNEDHSGITKTVAKSRRKFWIIRARKLAEHIRSKCYRCRRLEKELAQQLMAPLPKSRVKIAPTFHMVSMDLYGPMSIKDTVKQRTRKKVWGVILNCTVTRATHLDLTEDYSTDAILQTLRRFVSIRGCPSEIQSDQGSQLIGAAKDIAQLVEKWDWTPIHKWSANNKINWRLAPAEGQHQNGLSESLVKITKRSIENQIMNSVLTFSQLQTVLYEIANIMNSRPLGIISGSDPECPSPITPNDLILGRASSEVPQGPFDLDESKNIAKRFRFLQTLVSQWWNEWYMKVFPSLVPCYKWLQRHRNVRVGDICLIRYKNETRATYRMGRIHKVRTGDDGLVRSVVLQYKLPSERVLRTVERPIHGICVIVPIEEQQSTSRTEENAVNSTLNPDAPTFVSSS